MYTHKCRDGKGLIIFQSVENKGSHVCAVFINLRTYVCNACVRDALRVYSMVGIARDVPFESVGLKQTYLDKA